MMNETERRFDFFLGFWYTLYKKRGKSLVQKNTERFSSRDQLSVVIWMMELHASGEDYLEAIWILQKQMGEDAARSVDLARYMPDRIRCGCSDINQSFENQFLNY